MNREELGIRKALEARRMSYAPYSKFYVGAYLETAEGEGYQGCNIENAAYGPSNCAERTAFFKAVSDGKRDFTRITIVGGYEEDSLEYCPPCGVCLQVMREFCNPDNFEILVAKNEKDYQIYTLKELLPQGFGPEIIVMEEERRRL